MPFIVPTNRDATPYLSVIVAGRNDNYGGDFIQRLQRFVDRLSYLVEKFHFPSELVLVNYNPVPENESLETLIQWPADRSFLVIRMICVSPEIHQQFIDPDTRKTVPLFEFLAKNIGIRRALGTFLLVTNADILFSEQLFHFIARKTLKKACLYRANRIDFRVEGEEPLAVHTADFEKQVGAGAFEFFLQGGTFNVSWPRSLSIRLKLLSAYNGLRQVLYLLFNHFAFGRWINSWLNVYPENLFLLQHHCNASGDFALLDRNSWWTMGGYLEDTWIATHTDSLHLMNAATLGYETTTLPYPIFHKAHERRYDFSKPNPDMERMYLRLIADVKKMQKTGDHLKNKTDWGGEEYVLKEIEIK
jgi:hypothetical protein